MAWHLGYPLSQTLLTCVYVEALVNPAPSNVTQADLRRRTGEMAQKDVARGVLRAYCLGLLRACWFVNERIRREHYYEVRRPNTSHGSD